MKRRAAGPVRRASRLAFEGLEERLAFSAVPYGATDQDLSEFMIGTVLVTVVLFESNGTLDPSTQDWTQEEIDLEKKRFLDAGEWWETVFNNQGSLHSLDFQFDFTWADHPFSTQYELISRPSNQEYLWGNEFLQSVGLPGNTLPSNGILEFNHRQRLKYGTNWAFTAFVADAGGGPDSGFAPGGYRNAYAYPGGRYIVKHSMRPEMTVAHEMAHMFWAMDEYYGGSPYTARRGYYNAQNRNGLAGAPDFGDPGYQPREDSIMETTSIPWIYHSVSTSAKEIMGWRDSDKDGIFDVLDVPLKLNGTGSQDPATKAFSFTGTTEVGLLPNLNSNGTQHAMTLNRVGRIEYRFDNSPDWKTAVTVGEYKANVDFQVQVPAGASWIELRAAESTLPLYSEVFRQDVVSATVSPWWNSRDPLDVNDDQQVTPLDALLVVNYLNLNGAGTPEPTEKAPPFLDCNGDRVIAPIDALMVINRLNEDVAVRLAAAIVGQNSDVAIPAGEAEAPVESAAVAAAMDGFIVNSRREDREPSVPPRRIPTGHSSATQATSRMGTLSSINAVFADRYWCDPAGPDVGEEVFEDHSHDHPHDDLVTGRIVTDRQAV